MKLPNQYSREQLEQFSTNFLLELKSKWSIVMKMKDFTEYGDSKFIKKEAKNNIRLIRDIINYRRDV